MDVYIHRSVNFFGAIILGFVGVEVLNIPFIRIDLVPYALSLLGILMVVGASSVILYEKGKTKEQEIFESDECQQKIMQIAKSKAFDAFFAVSTLALLTLDVLGYMNKVSFFTLVIINIAGYLYFGYQYYNYSNKI